MANVPQGNYSTVNPSCPPGPPDPNFYQAPPPYDEQSVPPYPQPPNTGSYYPGNVPQPPSAYAGLPPQAVPGYGTPMPPQNVMPPQHYQPNYQMSHQKQPKKKGMFSGLLDDVTRGLDSAARDIGGFAGKTLVGDSMKILRTGSVVQLYYVKTGRTMQIIRHPQSGSLFVDMGGYFSPQAYNAHWFVHQENGNIIKLYNQDNFLGEHNGSVILMKAQNPVTAPFQTRWKVCQSTTSEKVISLESMSSPGSFITVAHDNVSLTLNKSSALSSNTYFNIQLITNCDFR